MRPALLLVEDNPDHALLIQTLLESAWPADVRLTVISDGQQALEYIRVQAQTPVFGLPDLVMLDLKLPKVNGLEILRELRRLSAWRSVPVIILTTSTNPADVQAGLAGGAAVCLSKLSALSGGMQELRLTLERYLSPARAPDGAALRGRP